MLRSEALLRRAGRSGVGVAEPEENPRPTPFFGILLYVLGFMFALALLAWAAACLLQHIR